VWSNGADENCQTESSIGAGGGGGVDRRLYYQSPGLRIANDVKGPHSTTGKGSLRKPDWLRDVTVGTINGIEPAWFVADEGIIVGT